MFGDGSQTRDFTFVTDAVQALHRVAEHGDLHGEVYNLASGRECSILQLAHLLGGQLGVQPDFEFSGHVRPGDPERWWADIGRLRALGYTPEVALEEGLERTVRWYQDEEKEPGGRR
jgi:nucleoside-diphosphate-sugar epimerase